MTNQQALTEHPDTLQPDQVRPGPPMPHATPRGFLDCRGEWQALDEDDDRDAAS